MGGRCSHHVGVPTGTSHEATQHGRQHASSQHLSFTGARWVAFHALCTVRVVSIVLTHTVHLVSCSGAYDPEPVRSSKRVTVSFASLGRRTCVHGWPCGLCNLQPPYTLPPCRHVCGYLLSRPWQCTPYPRHEPHSGPPPPPVRARTLLERYSGAVPTQWKVPYATPVGSHAHQCQRWHAAAWLGAGPPHAHAGVAIPPRNPAGVARLELGRGGGQ